MQKVLGYIFCLWLVVAPLSSQSDINWVACEDINNTLPSSLRAYEANHPDIPLHAWYVRADLSDQAWRVRTVLSEDTDGRDNVSQFAKKYNALVAINGGYFTVANNKASSVSLAVIDGKVSAVNIPAVIRNGITYYPTRSAFGLLANGNPDIAWVYDVNGVEYYYPQPSPIKTNQAQPQPNADFPEGGLPWQVMTALGGGPVLVHDNKLRVTWEEEVMFWSGTMPPPERHPRTAIGYTADNHLILMVVDGRQTASRGLSLHELGTMMLALGSVEALNLDGGGSSTLVINQNLINRPEGGVFQREVTTALVLQPAAPSEN